VLRLPEYQFQGCEAQVIFHESDRTQEMHLYEPDQK